MVLVAGLVLTLLGCGSSSSGSASTCSSSTSSVSNANSSAVPVMGISSPMAGCSSSSASLRGAKSSLFASLAGVFHKLTMGMLRSHSSAKAADIKTTANAANDIASTLDASTAAACVASVGTLTPSVSAVSCYGPGLNYTNHPDHSTPSSNTGNLPTGDLGVWSSAEADGEACSAAKANAVVQNMSDTVNGAIRMAAAVACLLNTQSEALPTSGTSSNMASLWNSSHTLGAGLNLTTATVQRMADDASGRDTFKTTIAGSGSLNGTFSIVLTHSQASTTDFGGRVYGYFRPQSTSKNVGFSVVYQRSADTMTALAKSGDNSAGASTTFFDGSNNFDFGSAGFDSNGYYNLISLDPTTGLGTIYSAWQAGAGDSHARVFNANTSRDGAGNDVGYSYFGYGPKVTEAGTGTINRMICNWAGPNNSHTGLSNKAQAQTLARNASGIFTVSADYITYAATNSCDNSSSDFLAGVTGSSQAAVGTVTNNLVTLGAVGTIPTITAPTY